MPGWARWTVGIVVALGVIGGGLYYWLIVDGGEANPKGYALDIAEIRRLANTIEGGKPIDIEVQEVASFSFPATALVAGDGWSQKLLPVYVYKIVYADRFGLIDTALTEEQGGGNPVAYDTDAFARVDAAIGAADFILITHEHMDHIGGLAAHGDLAGALARTRLTDIQIANPDRMAPVTFPAGALEGLTPFTYEGAAAVAPGVVVIAAPGHTPGSQMVFVQLADGREVLFLGDVAWHFRNIELVRERARLVTDFLLNENRQQVLDQFFALKALHEAEPAIAIVPGHDGRTISELVAKDVLTPGFE